VSKYNDDVTAYQSCIKLESDAEVDKQSAGKSDEEKKALKAEFERKLAEKNNAALDEVTAVVERFNEQLRAWKQKNPSPAKN
jgi:hypothetical protein